MPRPPLRRTLSRRASSARGCTTRPRSCATRCRMRSTPSSRASAMRSCSPTGCAAPPRPTSSPATHPSSCRAPMTASRSTSARVRALPDRVRAPPRHLLVQHRLHGAQRARLVGRAGRGHARRCRAIRRLGGEVRPGDSRRTARGDARLDEPLLRASRSSTPGWATARSTRSLPRPRRRPKAGPSNGCPATAAS